MKWCVFGFCSASALALACDGSSRAALAAPGSKSAEQLVVLVSNEVSGDLSFIDVESSTVMRTEPVGKRPRGLRVSSDGASVYVAVSGSPRGGPNVDERTLPPPDRKEDAIAVVDLHNPSVQRRLLSGNDPETLDLSPDGRWMAVANEDSGEASLIDAQSGALLARVGVGVEPEGVRFTPDGRHVYVSSEANDRVDVIDVAQRSVVARVPTGARPRNIVFSADGERAYVSCELAASVDVIDATEHRSLGSIAIDGEPRALPMGLALDEAEHRLYVTLGRAGEVAVIDTRARRVAARIGEVGARPWGIVLTPDGERLYTANGPSGDVSVIDTESLRVVRRIPVGKQPWGLATVRLTRR